MSIFPDDSAERKTFPLYSGVLQYFPSALAKLARHSYVSNEKHNPGEPIHWARGKSDDHLDAAARHLLEGDLAGLAWRALAALQLQCEAAGDPVAPGARNAETVITVKGVPIARVARNAGQSYTLKMDADGTIKSDPGAYYRWIEDLIDRWGGLSDVERDAIRAASPIPGHVACQSGEVVE